MQLNKASKKTRNADEKKAAAPEKSAAAEVTANPRTTRSSKTKKTETTESGTVKHRHNKVNSAATSETVPTLKANGAANTGSVIVDGVGVVALSPEVELPREASHEEIAKLAYSYWIARGYSHGAAEEDWLRAERELQQRR